MAIQPPVNKHYEAGFEETRKGNEITFRCENCDEEITFPADERNAPEHLLAMHAHHKTHEPPVG
jgi:hypothetical protein